MWFGVLAKPEKCVGGRLTRRGWPWYISDMSSTGMQTGLPMYRQLAARLKNAIQKGHYAPGERVASEHELSRQHNLARVTVRKATELLVVEGMLERRPGKGLYVREASNKAGVLKLMVGNLAWEPSIRIVRGAQAVAREGGFEVQVCDAHGDSTEEVESVQRLAGNGTAGAIIVALHSLAFNAAVARLKDQNFPFVLVDDRYGVVRGIPSVASDNYHGGFLVGRRMVELGHRRVAFIGDTVSTTVADRLEGFRDALAEVDIALPRIRIRSLSDLNPFEDWTAPVYRECDALFALDERPTAVFCSCDAIARCCYRHAAERGKRIPDELSIVGFDDDPLAEWLTPTLATVRQPFAQMGETAMRMLLEQLGGAAPATQKHRALSVELIERGSLAAPRKGNS